MSTTISFEQRVDADVRAVWDAWTTRAGLAAWWWPQIADTTYVVDGRVGGGYRIESAAVGIGVTGEYLSLDEPREIVMTWCWLDAGQPQPADLVTVSFTEPEAGRTLVTVVHELAGGPGGAEQYAQGWRDVLARLGALGASGAALSSAPEGAEVPDRG